jgi:acetyltransferase-like isoleucine patch superfamily enzyme
MRPLLQHSGGVLFVGRGASIKNPQMISHQGRLVIEDFAEVQGLAKFGLNFGSDISIGRATLIRPSSYYGGDVGVGLWVGDRSSMGAGCFIGCSGEIRIGSDVMMGPGVRLYSENHNFEDLAQTIKAQGVKRSFLIIEDDCWLGSGVTVTAGVKIGKGSIVAAGSVVTKDVPANSLVAGVPARVIRSRKSEK